MADAPAPDNTTKREFPSDAFLPTEQPAHTPDTLGEHDREKWDDWMGQEEMAAQSCCLQAVQCPQNAAHFQITPPVPVGAISSHTLTAAAGFCLQPNTQKC